MPSAGALIWISAKPLLKLVISTSFGFFLTKADLFGAVAARGAGQVLLNIMIPALLFSKIVPGFTAQNIVALDTLSPRPLILIACIYQLYGLAIAWITRKVFWVPRRFHYGILAAGVWNNWGDLPTAVIMSMTATAPFTSGDSDVAIAYVSAFILVSYVTLFPLGGYRVIAMDYADGAMPADSDDEVPESAGSRLTRRWNWLRTVIRSRSGKSATPDVETVDQSERSPDTNKNLRGVAAPRPRNGLSRHVSFNPSEPTAYNGHQGDQSTRPPTTTLVSPTPTEIEGTILTVPQNRKHASKSSPTKVDPTPATSEPPSRFKRALLVTRVFLISLASPATITMAFAFLIALVPTLKALFIMPPPESGIHIGAAPDGLPPLNIILDTATFIGNGSVPLALICLGSALARLQVPKPIGRAPLGAISAFSILKMVLGPVVGVLIVETLTHHTSLIDPEDKVLRFVCIYFSGVPTATTQVYLTQIYSPDGSAHHISAFLIPQYALMAITMTALPAYSLSILF